MKNKRKGSIKSKPEGTKKRRYRAEPTKKISTGSELAKQLELDTPPNRLMTTALTHPSYLFENPRSGLENNQRLEFLGDAILDFIVAEYLYLNYPERPEGELTKMRAAVVNETTLACKAKEINLGNELLLGKGEQVSGGRERPSILADAWEAVVGAIYLQYGLQEARRVSYRILAEEGPDHNKRFTAGVFLQGELKGKGIGRTKKEAEQKAAHQVLNQLGGEDHG